MPHFSTTNAAQRKCSLALCFSATIAGTDRGAKRGRSHCSPRKTVSHPANKSASQPQSSTSVISYCDSVTESLSQSLATYKAKPPHSIISEKAHHRVSVITLSKVRDAEIKVVLCLKVFGGVSMKGKLNLFILWTFQNSKWMGHDITDQIFSKCSQVLVTTLECRSQHFKMMLEKCLCVVVRLFDCKCENIGTDL